MGAACCAPDFASHRESEERVTSGLPPSREERFHPKLTPHGGEDDEEKRAPEVAAHSDGGEAAVGRPSCAAADPTAPDTEESLSEEEPDSEEILCLAPHLVDAPSAASDDAGAPPAEAAAGEAPKTITVVHNPRLLELVGKGWTDSEICRIRSLHTCRWEVELPGGDMLLSFTAWKLKRQLEDAHGLQAEDQVVRFRGRVLKDEEPLVSCGVMAGASLLLGYSQSPEASKNESVEGSRTCVASRTQGSLTCTVAEAAPDQPDQSQDPPGATPGEPEPWWVGSRLSGPLGRPLHGAPCRVEPSPGPSADDGAPPPGRADVQEELPNPEELRRLRLARFGG